MAEEPGCGVLLLNFGTMPAGAVPVQWQEGAFRGGGIPTAASLFDVEAEVRALFYAPRFGPQGSHFPPICEQQAWEKAITVGITIEGTATVDGVFQGPVSLPPMSYFTNGGGHGAFKEGVALLMKVPRALAGLEHVDQPVTSFGGPFVATSLHGKALEEDTLLEISLVNLGRIKVDVLHIAGGVEAHFLDPGLYLTLEGETSMNTGRAGNVQISMMGSPWLVREETEDTYIKASTSAVVLRMCLERVAPEPVKPDVVELWGDTWAGTDPPTFADEPCRTAPRGATTFTREVEPWLVHSMALEQRVNASPVMTSVGGQQHRLPSPAGPEEFVISMTPLNVGSPGSNPQLLGGGGEWIEFCSDVQSQGLQVRGTINEVTVSSGAPGEPPIYDLRGVVTDKNWV